MTATDLPHDQIIHLSIPPVFSDATATPSARKAR